MLPFVRMSCNNSFWHAPWSGKGIILSEYLDYNQRLLTGISELAKAQSYIINGSLFLPHVSSSNIQAVWNKIQASYTMMQDETVQWNNKFGYSISDIYKHLEDVSLFQDYPWFKRVWKCGSKPSENLFLWKLLNNSLLTQDKLVSKNILTASLCSLCIIGILKILVTYTFHVHILIAYGLGFYQQCIFISRSEIQRLNGYLYTKLRPSKR